MIVSSQSATMFGLVRAALGLSGMLLFLPLFGIATLLIPVFAAIEWLSLTDPTIRLMSSIIAAILAVAGSCFMASSHRTERYVTFLQIIVCIIAIVFLTFPYMTNHFEVHSKTKLFDSDIDDIKPTTTMVIDDLPANPLTWEQFHRYCNQPAWEKLSKVRTQIRCSHLDGTRIYWEGTVVDVDIMKVTNFRAQFIQWILPEYLENLVKCFYGDLNTHDCSADEDCNDMKKFLEEENQCNLDKWNT